MKSKVYINFRKFYKNGVFRITLFFGKKLFDFNLYGKWNDLMGSINNNSLNQRRMITNKKITIVWSGDDRLLPIYLLTKEEKQNLGVFGYTNRFINACGKVYCYRLKCEFVETADMRSFLGKPDEYFPEKISHKFISEQIGWRKKILEKPVFKETKERLEFEISFIEIIRNVKIRNL